LSASSCADCGGSGRDRERLTCHCAAGSRLRGFATGRAHDDDDATDAAISVFEDSGEMPRYIRRRRR
jgi:hypothetical protein